VGLIDKLKAKGSTLMTAEYGPVAAVFDFFQGRSTFFAIIFLIDGIILSAVAIWGIVHGKDISGLAGVIGSLAAFMGSLQALLFAHSAKEDWVDLQRRKLDLQQAQQNPPQPPCTTQQPPIQGSQN
jgi:hypothetical protein